MSSVQRTKEMNVGIESLYKAITGFEAYPDFLPEVVTAKRQDGATETKARVTFELEVVKKFEYVLEFEMVKPTLVKWKLVESNFFKTNDGQWSLKSLDAKKTEVNYSLDVSFGFLVPGWISRKLTETSLPKMFEHFEEKAKQIQG